GGLTVQGQVDADLGLAGPLDANAVNDPRYGKIVGTADYLSPDQVQSPWIPTPGWDIYALGCTLYYIVTGKVPFPGGDTADKARAHCELRPLDPRLLNPCLTTEFLDVMADMMAKNPAHRIPSAKAVVERLQPWMPGEPLADAPNGALGEYAQPKRQSSTPLAVQRPGAKQIKQSEHAEQLQLSETKVDFPELPQANESSDSSSKSVVTLLDLLNEQDSSEEMQIPTAGHQLSSLMPVMNPVLFLILTPVALLAATLLVYLVFRIIF
ncbi:MAG: protein kinase domain-containing protein, partial [Thermoguttaceae bacterium]